jgi:hypothetical protein
MHLLRDIALFFLGLLAAIATVALTRFAGSTLVMVQIPVIVVIIMVFFFKENRLAATTAGLGLGLDLVSAYPFLSWTVILGATAFFGWWISRTVLTNRSLPSLIILGVSMRAIYFVFELIVSRAAELFGGTVWYKITQVDFFHAFTASAAEMVALAAIFSIYVRVRGERSRMLTHVQ